MFYWAHTMIHYLESFHLHFILSFRLAGVDPNFGDPSSIVIDSFVLGWSTSDIMENWTNKPEVYELNESLSIDSTYYSFNTIGHNGINLVPTEFSTITPKPLILPLLEEIH